MSADKHFHPPAPVPEALEDHKPDDMPAARSLGIVILSMLLAGTLIAVYVSDRLDRAARAEPTPIERTR